MLHGISWKTIETKFILREISEFVVLFIANKIFNKMIQVLVNK